MTVRCLIGNTIIIPTTKVRIFLLNAKYILPFLKKQ